MKHMQLLLLPPRPADFNPLDEMNIDPAMVQILSEDAISARQGHGKLAPLSRQYAEKAGDGLPLTAITSRYIGWLNH